MTRCRCKPEWIPVDGKNNRTTPDRATGFYMINKPVHRGRATWVPKTLGEAVAEMEKKR